MRSDAKHVFCRTCTSRSKQPRRCVGRPTKYPYPMCRGCCATRRWRAHPVGGRWLPATSAHRSPRPHRRARSCRRPWHHAEAAPLGGGPGWGVAPTCTATCGPRRRLSARGSRWRLRRGLVSATACAPTAMEVHAFEVARAAAAVPLRRQRSATTTPMKESGPRRRINIKV